jgi:tRNA A-37 threonylcarbamoyl transferase component Bud32
MRKAFLYSILISLLVVSCTTNQDKDLRTPSSVTQQVREAGAIAWENLSEKRKTEVNIVRTNLMKYMLEASFKSDDEKFRIFKEAEKYLEAETTKVMANIKTEKLNPTSLEFFKIDSPPAWTLKEEVKWLTEKVKKENLPTPVRADAIYATLASMDFDQVDAGNQLSEVVNEDISQFIAAARSAESQRDISLLIVNKFEERLEEYFGKIKKLGTELKATGQLNLGNEEAEKFLVLFLDYYYSNVDQDVIKNIINDIIVLGREPERMELVGLMFQNSGPGLGKTLQQLGKEPSMGQNLQEVIEILEDDGKPVPYHLVKKAVDEDEAGFVLSHISKDPLGTGTMAQVNKAKLKVGNKKIDVALRFLKPGIEERANDDIKILSEFIEKMGEDGELSEDFLPTARKLVESIGEFLRSELDIPEAIRKQEFANQAYEGVVDVVIDGKNYKVGIAVPDVYKPKSGKKTNLHIQEFVTFGKKFSEIDDLKMRKVVAQGIMKSWFQEGLIDSGFIHSDLHQGNFTVNKLAASRADVTLFDFGMSETLRLETRKSFLLIGSGAKFKNAGLIADGMIADKKVSRQYKRKLIREIEKKMDEITKSEEWIVWGLREGYLQNDQLGTLARGGTLVSQLGRLVEDEDLAETVVEDLLKENVRKGYFSLKYDFPLSRTEVLRVGMASLGDSCSTAIKRFLKTK